MEYKTVDARGLACPIPVINTKRALEVISEGIVTTIVDNEEARDNVVTLANGMGCEVEIQQKGNEFHIGISKKSGTIPVPQSEAENIVIFVSSSELGRGSAELGEILINSFMYTLVESDTPPQTMVFVNSGVKLTAENSPVLEHLITLNQRGVEILSCGTCLDYFNLKEKLCVGNISNMYTIYEKLGRAQKVISL